MKLNEFKKAKLNELDLSSIFGDHGSAAIKTGLGSLGGKHVLSTTDQMAKDDFIKKFNSRAASGLQSAINSGLVDMAAQGSPQPVANPGATPQAGPQGASAPQSGISTPGATGQTPGQAQGGPKTPEQIRKEKQAAAGRVAQDQMAANPAKSAVAPTAGRNVSPTPAQTRQQKLATATTAAQGQMAPFSKLPAVAPATPKTPEQIRQEKQAAATQTAQGQMANNGPLSKLPANQAAVQAGNIRQQKQGAATTAAQGQMAPVSKLPADQFAKTAATTRQAQQGQAATAAQGQMTPKVAGPTPKTPEQIRQAKQLAATQAAQGQMNPASKLPADQFAKSADNVRQQQQTTATQTAQQQMATPKQVDPRFPNGKYDGVTGEATPEYQKELDKQEAARLEKQKVSSAANKADGDERDAAMTRLNQRVAQQNTPNVTQTTTAPNASVVTTDPAEVKAAMQAKMDAMKQKNPKLAAQMADLGMDDEFNDKLDAKPDNTVQMPNQKKTTPGSQAFGQMAQNLGKVAEGSRFDKLNYLFESILAEQDPTQSQGKQSISQYITNFFKQFMKGVNITDPTVVSQVATLAKELEQTYSKDKGNSTLPKLADLAWSVSHAQAEQEPPQGTTKTPDDPNNPPNNSTQAGAIPPAPTKQLPPARQIGALLNKLNSTQKKQLLASLEKELGLGQKKPATKSQTGDTGGTYNKKTGAAKLGGKSMVAATDLPPNIQKQLQQK